MKADCIIVPFLYFLSFISDVFSLLPELMFSQSYVSLLKQGDEIFKRDIMMSGISETRGWSWELKKETLGGRTEFVERRFIKKRNVMSWWFRCGSVVLILTQRGLPPTEFVTNASLAYTCSCTQHWYYIKGTTQNLLLLKYNPLRVSPSFNRQRFKCLQQEPPSLYKICKKNSQHANKNKYAQKLNPSFNTTSLLPHWENPPQGMVQNSSNTSTR